MSPPSASETIQQTIIEDATAEAKRIIREAEIEAKQIEMKARENAQVQLEGWANRQRQMAQGAGDQVLGKARNDAHMRLLDAKASIIAQAFANARKRFKKERSKAQYKKLLKSLIIQAGFQIKGGNLVILARKEDLPTISSLTGLATAISKETGVKTKVTVGKKPLTTLGGVMIQNEDGNITVDYRLETLLEQVERIQRSVIAKLLFTED
jgi:V/A-type H+-transporting ATPase subunit E